MSTLKADTIQSTSGGAATLTKQSAAKAWAKYTQSGPTINNSFNIASIADNSAGNFTPSFTNAMSSANYVFPAISGEKHIQQSGTDATGSFTLISSSAGNSAGDGVDYVTVHGDLA